MLEDGEEPIGMSKVGDEIKTYRRYFTLADYTPWLLHPDRNTAKMIEDDFGVPCIYTSGVVDYMNLYYTRQALHIPDEVQAWEYCVVNPEWYYISGRNASFYIYEEMFKDHPEINMLFYSGDTDGSVPTRGTMDWMNQLDKPITKTWNYTLYEGQLAGYVTEYANQLTFGTVHGCGHMAPQWKRP